MHKAGGQGRFRLTWVASGSGLGGGCFSGVTACGTESREREQPTPQVTSSEAFPDLFPVPLSPCWEIHPARDTSHQHSTSKPSVTHQTSGLHSTACINPVPIFALKAVLSKAIQMPEIRDYYDFMSCWKTGGGEHNVCVRFKCLMKSFLSFLIDVASVFRLELLRGKKKSWRSYSEK